MDTTLISALAALVRDQAHGLQFEATGTAPETMQGLVVTQGRYISGLYSDTSIYGDAQHNILFRAWHDSLHLQLGAGFDFTPDGETRVALEQARIASQYGEILGRALWADTYGQGAHYLKYGAFPVDQQAFVSAYLITPQIVRQF